MLRVFCGGRTGVSLSRDTKDTLVRTNHTAKVKVQRGEGLVRLRNAERRRAVKRLLVYGCERDVGLRLAGDAADVLGRAHDPGLVGQFFVGGDGILDQWGGGKVIVLGHVQ